MWGLLFFAVLGIGGFIYSCKNDAEDARDRQKSRDNDEAYYFDHVGKQRRVDNNHQVMRTFQKNGTHLDDVMMDMKTGQVLHNYTNDKRHERNQREQEDNSKNRANREQARAAGRYYYLAYREPPVICGLYGDMYATQYAQSPISVDYWHYPNVHYRRVSDNLLLSGMTDKMTVVEEARFNLRLWDEKAERDNDAYKINTHVEWNWKIIHNWESRPRVYWKEKTPYPTEKEVEEYARQVGAYLDKREIIPKEDDDDWVIFNGVRIRKPYNYNYKGVRR